MIAPMSTGWHEAARPGARVGGVLESHEAIGSTNDRARELLEAGAPDGVTVVAELQTAGRGRRGRRWTSAAGRNVTVSIGLRPRLSAGRAPEVGLATGLALHAAAGRHASVRLKWPNDLVAPSGRKVAGILVEAASDGDRLRHVVIGAGVNVNWTNDDLPPDLAATATSLGTLAGHPIDRVGLLRDLLTALDDEVAAIESGRSPVDRYRAACSTLGARVTVELPGGARIDGRAEDLDSGGALLVRRDGGELVTVTSGEVVRVRASGDAG